MDTNGSKSIRNMGFFKIIINFLLTKVPYSRLTKIYIIFFFLIDVIYNQSVVLKTRKLLRKKILRFF